MTSPVYDCPAHSADLALLGAALSKAQAEIEGASKDSVNPHFKSKYADLASVWDACRGPLTKYGLSVVQLLAADGAKVTVTTMLLHSSGQWIKSELSMTAQKNDPQGIGSCATYARRYSLSSMVGVAPEDDDGNAASASKPARGGDAPAPVSTARRVPSSTLPSLNK